MRRLHDHRRRFRQHDRLLRRALPQAGRPTGSGARQTSPSRRTPCAITCGRSARRTAGPSCKATPTARGCTRPGLFPGVLEFFDRCRRVGREVFIISHRTRYPFLGERHDLHQAARDFLAEHGFNDPARIGLAADHIHFHESRQEKVAQINQVGCTHFIDDLPEILAARGTSCRTSRDPLRSQSPARGLPRPARVVRGRRSRVYC